MGPRKFLYLLFFFGAASLCRANTLTFTATGTYDFSFQMDSNPTPGYYQTNGNTTIYYLADVMPAGLSPLSIVFWNGGYGGAFTDFQDGNGFAGQQVYSGTEAHPVFSPGVFTFSTYDPSLGGGNGDNAETLTIALAPTPEPSSWLLLLTGLGAMGLVALRRTRAPEAIRPA